ncbi:hypothetical protein AB1Y20_006471 [Prymnesium parvum]|uniref:Peptidase S49 domain-containing protein n=1 Tax=Prymnesium parvum TaxID=97485 RepID=A0AB34IYK5_PRYPA
MLALLLGLSLPAFTPSTHTTIPRLRMRSPSSLAALATEAPPPRLAATSLAAAAAATPLAALAQEASPLDAFLASDDVRQLGIFFAQTVITWGVPATVLLFLGLIFAGASRPPAEEEEELPPPLAKLLGISREPKEFLKVQRLNGKLQSFNYSLAKAATSKEAALRANERLNFARRFGSALAAADLGDDAIQACPLQTDCFLCAARKVERAVPPPRQAITKAAGKYRKADEALRAQQEKKLKELRLGALSKGGAAAPREAAGNSSAAPMERMQRSFSSSRAQKDVARLQAKRLALEASFLSSVGAELPPSLLPLLADLLKSGPERGAIEGAPASGGSLDALAAIEDAVWKVAAERKHVFVLKFNGDVTASQVSQLRQEVTAVLGSSNATRGDEVVLVLNTGGGTVTGYGLAAAQLVRLKQGGLPLTICVEQVAASGGYMMACVADRLVASPFAVLGSIGVITEQPNVYERLKREGIVFSTVTAGKYKRTLTPTKKVDPEDQKKLKQDIEQILVLFKDFVKANRPVVDIEEIATGETWFGPDALERKLVDELRTSDDVLLDFVHAGAEVFAITYKEDRSPLAALAPGGSLPAGGGWRGLALAALTRWLGSSPASREGQGAYDYLQPPRIEEQPSLRSKEGERYLVARPRDEVEPQLRWSDARDEANQYGTDSWPF